MSEFEPIASRPHAGIMMMGALLLVVGIISTIYGLTMETYIEIGAEYSATEVLDYEIATGESSSEELLLPSQVSNLELIRQQLLWVAMGSLSFLSGLLLLCTRAILSATD